MATGAKSKAKDAPEDISVGSSFRGVDPENFDGPPAPYAVDGNDTSGYENVSQEYQTYSTAADAPPNEDGKLVEPSDSDSDADADNGDGGQTPPLS